MKDEYAIGDEAWCYVGSHEGHMSKGKVVAALDLPGYGYRHYVVEIPTSIDPLLEVRDAMTMRPLDPRLDEVAGFLSRIMRKSREECVGLASEIVDMVGA